MDKKKKNVILALAAAAGGLSATVIASQVAIYDKVFPRYERADYSITPGVRCLDRFKTHANIEAISFYSDDVLLKGNYFSIENPKGIVLVAHGIHAGGDDYLNVIGYFLDNGYNVFSFNYKGTYESEGDSTVGLCESLVDVDHAIKHIQQNEKYNKLPLFLFGHSWGGYAVTSALEINNNIKACASVSGMNSGYTMIVEKAQQYVGQLSKTSKPFFDIYQKFLFKDYVKYKGDKGINNSNIPVVIAHGADDSLIVYNKQAIIAHKDKITNPNVKYYVGKGYQGDHSDILLSNDAIIYKKEIKSELRLLEMQKGKKLSYEELQNFYKTVDHLKYSEVNKDLMDLIIKTFDEAL